MVNLRRFNRRWHVTPWGWQWIASTTFARILAARYRKHKQEG
jgi:hypothetical protein